MLPNYITNSILKTFKRTIYIILIKMELCSIEDVDQTVEEFKPLYLWYDSGSHRCSGRIIFLMCAICIAQRQ